MNYRERLIRSVRFQPVDELPFRHAYGLMPGVLDRWHEQGLPRSVRSETDLYDHFGFTRRPRPLPVNVGFDPPFESRVLEDTPEYRVALDDFGRVTKVIWATATLPVALTHPLQDRKDWADYRRRLTYSPARIGADLEAVAAENMATGRPNVCGTMGFYWFPRNLMGDEGLCVAYYEQPDLVHEILDTWCGLVERALSAALERARLDGIHFGEDMAFKTSSMVGKRQFDEFIRPYYLRIRALVQRYEVPIFSVDTDGCLHELVDWFAGCGVNYIGPNEVQAGNDITAYRRRLGATMAYDGGLDKRAVRDGREAIDAMLDATLPVMKATGGGWSVSLDHRVLENTPLDHFRYYVDRVWEAVKF